mgnify:FL=1
MIEESDTSESNAMTIEDDTQGQLKRVAPTKTSKTTVLQAEEDFPFQQHEVKEVLILKHQEQNLPHGITLAVIRKFKKVSRRGRGQLILCDLTNKQELFALTHDRRLTYCDLHFIPKLRLLLHQDQTKIFYYFIDFKRFKIIPRGFTMIGAEIISIRPAKDNMFLCHTEDIQTICFNYKTQKSVFKITNPQDPNGNYPFHVFLSNRNAFAMINCPEGAIKIFDFYSRNLLVRTNFEEERITAISYIPEKDQLMVGLYKLFEHSQIHSLDLETLAIKNSMTINDCCVMEIIVDEAMETFTAWFTAAWLRTCTLDSFETIYQYKLNLHNLNQVEKFDENGKFLTLGEKLYLFNLD